MSLQADKQASTNTCYTMVNRMNPLMAMSKIFCSCSVQLRQRTRCLIRTQYDGPHFGDIHFLHCMSCHACSYTYFKEKCYVMNISISLLWNMLWLFKNGFVWFWVYAFKCMFYTTFPYLWINGNNKEWVNEAQVHANTVWGTDVWDRPQTDKIIVLNPSRNNIHI
jgi:hypothetical protein